MWSRGPQIYTALPTDAEARSMCGRLSPDIYIAPRLSRRGRSRRRRSRRSDVGVGTSVGGMSPGDGDRPAIRTEGLTKQFGSFTALDKLTLDVEVGEVFGFLGPNGAGKSTTLRLLLGLIRPTAGSASILGVDVSDVRRCTAVAYVPGDVNLWPKLTGGECLALLANFHGKVDNAYRNVLVDRFQLDTAKKARTYSKGNRQKVALVAAFATRAEVLLLDEPTSGLDPLMEKEFRTCVGEARSGGRRCSCRRTSSPRSSSCAPGWASCGRASWSRSATRRLDCGPCTATELEIDFDGEPPDLSTLEGVELTARTPNGVRLKLIGSPALVLDAIHGCGVTGLRSHEASLEEIFLAYYGGGTNAGRTDDDGTT